MRGKKKICWGILVVFLVSIFQPTISYAKELVESINITKGENVETSTNKDKDVIVSKRLKLIIEKLDTKENVQKFIITNEEIKDMKEISNKYDVAVDKIYVSNKYNRTNELFELRQKIIHYSNILCNARNTSNEVKEEFKELEKIIVEVNIELLDNIILLIDENIKDRPVDINNNIFIEIKDMHEKAKVIHENNGTIQTVDIQKYAHSKGLQVLENLNIELPEEDNGEKPEENPEDKPETEDKNIDTDEDGLKDFIEDLFNGDKNKEDTDEDGLTDEQEYILHPYCKLDNPDTDGNGTSDLYEDLDKDGLTNEEEFKYNTHPLIKDTDLDGLNDKDEIIIHKTDPNKKDTDEDGLSDSEEIELGTNPLKKDSNNNGIDDGDEKYTKVIEENEINIEAKGEKEAIESIRINESNDNVDGNIPGQISKIYDVNYEGNIENLKVTFNIDTKSKNFKNLEDSKVMYFDEEAKVLKLVDENQQYNSKSNQIKVDAKIGKRFILVSYSSWIKAWQDYKPSLGKPNVDGNLKRDFLILMDNSAIMRFGYDKENERIGATEWFTDRLFKDDRIAFAKFNKKIHKDSVVNLTNNKDDVKKALNEEIEDDYFLDSIKDIWGDALNIIKPDDEKDKDREKYIIFLTTTYPNDEYETVIRLSKYEKVRVVVFDCHEFLTDHNYFKKLAYQTGGKYLDPYYHSANLWGSYKMTLDYAGGGNNIDNTGKDSDGDGISDELETNGIRDGYGVSYKTNPNDVDTDKDGIEDGAEVFLVEHDEQNFEMENKEPIGMEEENGGKYFRFLSDPSKADTDSDGVDDLYEVELGISNPFKADEDYDGLTDLEEIEIGTSTKLADTDGDDYSDKKESLSKNLNPLIYDTPISVFQYVDEFLSGFLLGDLIENPTTINLVGAIAGNLTPMVGTAADVRDMIINAVDGDFVTAGLNLAGIIPGLGDSAQVVAKLTSFFENFKYADRLTEVLPIVLKWGDELLPSAAKLDLIKKMLIANGAIHSIGNFFGINGDNNRAISKDEISEQISEILLKIYNKVEIDIGDFVKSIEELGKLDDAFIKKDFKRFGELIREVALDENNKYSVELAKKFLEDTSLHLDIITMKSTKEQKQAMISRLKGYIGEFVDSNKNLKENYTSLLSSSKKVINHGPDVVGLKQVGDRYKMKIIESKTFKKNLSERNLTKYFKSDDDGYFLNLDHILGYVSNKKDIMEKIRSGKVDIEFDLSILQGDEAKNLGITKNLKENIYKGQESGNYADFMAKYDGGEKIKISIKWGTNRMDDFLN